METLIYLDTHVAAWLYAGRSDLLPGAVIEAIEREVLLVSPMVVLELAYLHETGRVRESAAPVIAALHREIGLAVCDLPFGDVVANALDAAWTRDPFDRLIVSQAALRRARLVTRDRSIHDAFPGALWD